MLYLVHHAHALAPDVDHMRPLSSLGRGQAERVARAALARGAKPAAVWHSGKLRAKQTAEICWRTLNPEIPAESPTPGASGVLIAGHMPHLPRLLRRLTTGRRDGLADFPQHGCVALERTGDRWEERWRID